ncbi:putative murein peptide carboxypeptidase [Neomoorella glycerini]|uniref:Putative murein peptide carboxypeptidase n=1 Tax=Neomoorella glycerini TaxID=55779 RepID=A0A6I5ZSP7_9FIRM|nr:LD-carboxypeptidase [Moorella glycerini]QGP92749.1 putative murein peptide carboxypeptidase [Moorella glycerini]
MSGPTTILKPPALLEGDTIGIIAPASPLADPAYLARGIRFWRSLGYRVRTGAHISKAAGYLAGSDAGRLADLHQMFRDPEVKAITCLRGGYGTLRLLADLDYNLIRCHPKILVGYSDITALHLALNKMTGLVTFHGPMLYPELGSEDLHPYTRENLCRALTVTSPLGSIPPAPGLPPPVTITPGQAEGIVTGGNLSLVVASLGTPFEIDTRGKILFLEEVDEAPYRLDRLLTQLKLAGKLEAAAGIVFGICTGCGDSSLKPGPLEVITGHLAPLGIPCFYGLPAGHLATQATLPLGISARLDAAACTLTYLEAAVAPSSCRQPAR